MDDCNGLMYNNRRLSRDSEIIRYIERCSQGKIVNMLRYSMPLFFKTNCIQRYFDKADEYEADILSDDVFFIEGRISQKNIDDANLITIFKWDKIYPADTCFDCDLSEFEKYSEDSIAGTSHGNIIIKKYRRKII